nr:uncharacterized protein LOC106690752 [Halyomorpha halys]
MKCNIVLLFVAAFLVAVVKASVYQGQDWRRAGSPVNSVNNPARPGTVTTTAIPSGTFIFQVPGNCNCPAPPQYDPVCGTDGNTYVNRQKLDCARKCGFDVQAVRMGAC